MKLNEFKWQLNELDLSSFIGDMGAAAVRSGLGSLTGRSSGNMSTQERQAYDTYIKSFVGNYANELNRAVQSGLVTTSPAPQAQQAQQAQQAPQAPSSPAQIRQQKQAVAAQAAQAQMAPVSKLPANQPAVAAVNIRQQKQGQAAAAAQQQMAPVSKLPANQFAKSAANVRQQQQSLVTPTTQPTRPTSVQAATPTPAQVRQQKQAQARNAIQAQMNSKPVNTGKPAHMRESVLNEQMTISQFIFNKISKGLINVNNIQQYLPGLQQKANQIEKAYIQAGGDTAGDRAIKEPLTQLAKQSYVILRSEPQGAQQGPLTQQGSPATLSAKKSTLPVQKSAQKKQPNLSLLVKQLNKTQKRKLLTLLQKSITGQKVSIGGQRLDPNNPQDAKIIQQLQLQQGKKAG